MFLLILESIGTSELFLIGVVALMFLGPRKLPQMARKIGKLMAEFRATTSEFRSTWEKEVDFAEEEENLKKDAEEMSAQQVARLKDVTPADAPALPDAPAIKQIDESAFKELQAKAQNGGAPAESPADAEPQQEVRTTPGKQDWL